MYRIAVFASGNGTNLQALLDAASRDELGASVALVVSDRPDCQAVERARRAGVDVFAARPSQLGGKVGFESLAVRELSARGVDLVILAGYMRLVGNTLLNAFDRRIINLHPALLPEFPGKNAIAQAFTSGAIVTGVTVHFVDAGMDTGPIIAQEQVPVLEDDTLEQLEERVHLCEHKLLPRVVRDLAAQTPSASEMVGEG
jgi:phosphoribosylglycinamide formyltransferase-1